MHLCVSAPWLDHVLHKAQADLVLDTVLKNGHTSSVDVLWAGDELQLIFPLSIFIVCRVQYALCM
jgi:hypothetical protein